MSNTETYRASLWPMPEQQKNAQGSTRRLGVELEFIELPLARIADITQKELGGEITTISDYEVALNGTRLGDFNIELDYAYLKKLGRSRNSETKVDDLDNLAESLLALIARKIVPYEIVSPPIPMTQVWQLDSVIKALREAGARGTNHATEYAFGLHLNPEMPNADAKTILAYLQAFVCLYDWLRARSDIDFSRWVTPYVDGFGGAYNQLVIQADYAPDMDQLIDDYLRLNPTRNRALDMLPLFADIDEQRVRNVIDDDRIKARPALHYRLPDCLIDETDWGLIRPWRDWLQIEQLANDPTALAKACQDYADYLARPTDRLFKSWRTQSTRYLLPELL